MTPPALDGHWLDFYALLDVPASADEDTIRKRIGKLYSAAAANSDHRDLERRHYFQALLERVLPQCRRVLLDPQWRAQYDAQHKLNASGDPAAQNYIAFIASMRGQSRNADDETLPQRVQEDINLAREVVECAWQGAQLELLPTHAVSSRETTSNPANSPNQTVIEAPVMTAAPLTAAVVMAAVAPDIEVPVAVAPVAQASAKTQAPVSEAPLQSPTPIPAPVVEEIVQSGSALHAQVITGEEAAAIRRGRAVNSAHETVVSGTRANSKTTAPAPNAPLSRVSVGDVTNAPRQRVISPTSLNLMVAIVGVILTITIQHFSNTPAVANAGNRTAIFLSVAPEMKDALQRAETAWEKTPDGAGFDIVVQNIASRAGSGRVVGAGSVGESGVPDAWIPSDTSWVERYNSRAPGLKRQTIGSGEPLAQSPMVLIARAERAAELRRLFPRHQISSWDALRGAIARGAAGHLGLSDPQQTESGALARVSMAREWGAQRGISPAMAAKNPDFWRWMAAFEDNAPSASARTDDMVKDMARGTTGRFWWVVAYESDALQWMNAGKQLEIFYLPRTTYANHPFCALERVGASNEVAVGRAAFEKFLRSQPTQKALLDDGFRPTEINLKVKTAGNPFLNPAFRARGARTDGLPLEERANAAATEIVAQQWGKRYG